MASHRDVMMQLEFKSLYFVLQKLSTYFHEEKKKQTWRRLLLLLLKELVQLS